MFWKKKKIQTDVDKSKKTYDLSIDQKEGILPTFEYHNDVLESGVIRKETIKCDCCNEDSDYIYDGPIYGQSEIEEICPWCIFEGRAHSEYNVSFNSDFEGDEIPQVIKQRIAFFTPSYLSWQDPVWLTHCNDACIFIGSVGHKEIKKMGIEDKLSGEFDRLSTQFSMTSDEFKQHLVNDGDIQGYLFQCKHCGKYKLHADSI